jgi:uncharacterized protein YqeY
MGVLYEKLNGELKKAMLAKDRETSNIVRGIKAKLQEFEVASGADRSIMPPDAVVLKVIMAHKKSLEKAIVQLKKVGDRSANLIKEYKTEIAFCDTYLPSSEDQQAEISRVVDETIESLGINNLKQLGQAMGHIMKNNASLDGKLVKEAIFNKIKSITLEKE